MFQNIYAPTPPHPKKLIRSKFQINLHLKAWHRTPYCFRVMKLSFTSDTRGDSGSCNRKYDEMKLPFKNMPFHQQFWADHYRTVDGQRGERHGRSPKKCSLLLFIIRPCLVCVRACVCWNICSLRRWQKWQMSPRWRQYLSLHRCIKIPQYVEPLIRSAINKKCVLISDYAEAHPSGRPLRQCTPCNCRSYINCRPGINKNLNPPRISCF